MIGDLLEFAIHTDAIGPAVDFYKSLGFHEAPVSDIVEGPYAALCIEGLSIGLRKTTFADPVPTFVRPDLKNHLRGLRREKISLEYATLHDDSFHRAAFQDPNGQLIELLEARAYPPVSQVDASISVAGVFIEYSIPAASLEDSLSFWEKLGIRPEEDGTSPEPWARISGHGLCLGLYSGRRFQPGLTFKCSNLAARVAYLEATGSRIESGAPFGDVDLPAATLRAPDDQAIYIFEIGS